MILFHAKLVEIHWNSLKLLASLTKQGILQERLENIKRNKYKNTNKRVSHGFFGSVVSIRVPLTAESQSGMKISISIVRKK